VTPPSFSDCFHYVLPPLVFFNPIVMSLSFIPSCSNHSCYIIRLGSTESPCFPTNILLCHTLVEPQYLHTPIHPDCFIANLHHPPVVRQGLPPANWRTPPHPRRGTTTRQGDMPHSILVTSPQGTHTPSTVSLRWAVVWVTIL